MTQIRVVERPDADEVDGFCVACKAEVIVSAADRRCPDCGEEVHPDSLPSQERLQALRDQLDAPVRTVAVSPVQPSERRSEKLAAPLIVLPASRAATAWRRATEGLLEAAEREQQDARQPTRPRRTDSRPPTPSWPPSAR